MPRQLQQDVSTWRGASSSLLLNPSASAEDVAVASETRRAALLERESALQRWAVALELQAARQSAAAAALRAQASENEKQRSGLTADARAADARRGQLDVLAAELSKEREYLTTLAGQLQVRWGCCSTGLALVCRSKP
jgi:PHD/YefM family antitoxin component YafN of YafNO toxin-antitoxin module